VTTVAHAGPGRQRSIGPSCRKGYARYGYFILDPDGKVAVLLRGLDLTVPSELL
jgi:hypothetical protein